MLLFNVTVKQLLLLIAMKVNESLFGGLRRKRKKWMLCIRNVIGWVEDRDGGSAHRVT